MAIRTNFVRLFVDYLDQRFGDRFEGVKETATKWGKGVYQQLEGKRQMLARSLEKELDVKTQYRRIQSKLAQDLAELEMRKAVLEKEVSAEEKLLFEEAYEHARNTIIQQRMQEASSIFQPNTRQKLRDELLASFVRILKGEKPTNTPKVDEV